MIPSKFASHENHHTLPDLETDAEARSCVCMVWSHEKGPVQMRTLGGDWGGRLLNTRKAKPETHG